VCSSDLDVGGATLRALASHRSELPAWRPYYSAVTPEGAARGDGRAMVLDAVIATPREPNGGAVRYSDVGYILLGEAAARATGRALAELVRDEVTRPLGLDDAMGYRAVDGAADDAFVAPTERCAWRGRVVQGSVHDENAFALGGVSAHAWLFATAAAVASVGAAALDALDGESGWFPPAVMAEMIAPRPGGTHRLGWDGREPTGSSAGGLMGPRTFGHLGFTGTSLWVDPDARVVVALLTNRVHPTRENLAIRALRVAVHDAVMSAVGAA
jgi:CubicO group peptidase (beta-lactamase class C family)